MDALSLVLCGTVGAGSCRCHGMGAVKPGPTSRVANKVFAHLRQTVPQNEGLASSNSIPVETARAHDARSENQWGTVHGFYVIMGGYVLAESQGICRGALSPNGVMFLLNHDPEFVPFIRKQDILDRSKNDAIAKILACLQALWFCIQVLSRFVAGLDVTLLELNTLAHCLGVVGIYSL